MTWETHAVRLLIFPWARRMPSPSAPRGAAHLRCSCRRTRQASSQSTRSKPSQLSCVAVLSAANAGMCSWALVLPRGHCALCAVQQDKHGAFGDATDMEFDLVHAIRGMRCWITPLTPWNTLTSGPHRPVLILRRTSFAEGSAAAGPWAAVGDCFHISRCPRRGSRISNWAHARTPRHTQR